MKRSKQDTAATRAAIIENASREFRQNGLQLSVADVMQASGLTHGGFYRHFETKEELVAEAARHALRSVIQDLIDTATGEGDKKTNLRRLIEKYLSGKHRDDIAEGCLIAALGGEFTRTSEDIREIIISESSKLIEAIANLIDDAKPVDDAKAADSEKTGRAETSDQERQGEKLESAQFLAASMTGILTMSRLMPVEPAEKFLASARQRLIETYCSHPDERR